MARLGSQIFDLMQQLIVWIGNEPASSVRQLLEHLEGCIQVGDIPKRYGLPHSGPRLELVFLPLRILLIHVGGPKASKHPLVPARACASWAPPHSSSVLPFEVGDVFASCGTFLQVIKQGSFKESDCLSVRMDVFP